MRNLLIAAAAAAIFAVPAQSASFSDNFDAETGVQNASNYTLNYTGFANWDVSANTSVDILKMPNIFGLCSTGACVDLAGSSSNAGEIITKQSYGFNAGDLVTFSIQVAGSQRNDAANEFYFGLNFDSPTDLDNGFSSINGGLTSFGPYAFNGAPVVFSGGFVNSGDPFTVSSISFRALTSGSAKLVVGSPLSSAGDNVGPLLDNVSFTSGAVPEPASWAMMIGGFGLVGGALRRRKGSTSVRFA